MFWIGIAIGLFIGVVIGFVIAAFFAGVAHQNRLDDEYSDHPQWPDNASRP